MSQRRLHSLIEAVLNTMFGFGISVAVGYYVYPLFGWNASLTDVSTLTAIFTGLSILRGYIVRRIFNWAHERGWK